MGLYNAAKGLYHAGKAAAHWAVPTQPRLDQSTLDGIVDGIIRNNGEVRKLFEQRPTDESHLRKQLEYAVHDAYHENRNLRRFATYVDVADKLLVPIDMVADGLKILGGIGYGVSLAKEAAEMVFKLPYMAYYSGRTHDFVGTVGNLAYEGFSWFIPGSVLDLTNRYAKQADKYIVKDAAKKFLEKMREQPKREERAA